MMSLTPSKSSAVGDPYEKEAILSLSIQIFLGMLGMGLVVPVLPLLGQEFGVSTWLIGLLVTAFGVGRFASDVPGGLLSERFGRRELMVAGFLVLALGAILSATARTYEQLLLSRLIQGVGSGAQQVSAMASLADVVSTRRRGRAMSIYQGSLLLGWASGPVLGGILASSYGFRSTFVLYALVAALAALWTAFRIQNSASPVHSSGENGPWPTRNSFLVLITERSFVLVSVMTFVTFFTRSGAQLSLLPLLGKNLLTLSTAEIGSGFAITAIASFPAVLASGMIADKFGRKVAIVPGILMLGVSLGLFAVSGSRAMFFASALLMGLGTGLGGSAPAAYVTELVPEGKHGATMGLYRSLGDAGFVLGPVVLGAFADAVSLRSALILNSLFVLLAVLIFGMFSRETLVRPHEGQTTP